MSDTPLVSIVTPMYNQMRYLEETLQSVLSQTYRPIEYIVVNDGSTDGSRAILERYRDRVKIIDQENMGQARALNRGWDYSSGTLLGYLSSDDVLAPQCIERLVETLLANDGIVCAFPNCDLISEDSKVLKRRVVRPFKLTELVVEQECYIGPGALWRASAHRAIGGWKPELKLAPDREYWMRLASHGELQLVDETLAGYRLHPQSISYKVTSEEVSLEYIRVLDEYFAAEAVPSSISSRLEEAYANAYWVVARNMVRDGSYEAAFNYVRLATRFYPKSLNLRHLLMLARTSVGKPLRLLIGRIKSGVGR